MQVLVWMPYGTSKLMFQSTPDTMVRRYPEFTVCNEGVLNET